MTLIRTDAWRLRSWLLNLALIVAFSMSWGVAGTPLHAEEYRLGPQDRVRLKVYEWRPARDEVYEFEPFSAEFTIGPEGTLSLPIIGDVTSKGLTVSELSTAISNALRERMGLTNPPKAAVDIVQFRPIYVAGTVEKPGEYPFRPQMTVIQAVTVAGGLVKVSDTGMLRIARDSITGRGELSTLTLERAGLLAKKARLEAELAGAPSISFPADLTTNATPPLKLQVLQEQAIFDARREAAASQIDALQKLKTFLDKEIVSLTAQLQTADTQMQLINKELAGVSSLVEKGLAVSPRQLQLERTVAQLQGDRLRQETEILRARQELSKTDISINEVRTKLKNDVSLELRITQGRLDEVSQKIETSRRLLYEAEVTTPALLMERSKAAKIQPTYTIMRPQANGVEEVDAVETTRLEPGDTLKVQLPVQQNFELMSLGQATQGG
jgi:polysaccharide export outer membrane protein/exopolysaccharide production protein ExoF